MFTFGPVRAFPVIQALALPVTKPEAVGAKVQVF
jgi:hypothetical protein